MTRGAGVHFAPSGWAGMLIFHGVSLFTSIVKASERPSGDQLTLAGVSVTRVTETPANVSWSPDGRRLRHARDLRSRPLGIHPAHEDLRALRFAVGEIRDA